MGRKAPAFQFYADDFLAGTLGMTDAEKGVYVTMLCLQWTKGGLGERELRAAGGHEEVQYVLGEKFKRGPDGRYRNSRLEEVKRISTERSTAGSKGGSKTQAKGQAKREANEAAKLKPPSPSPSPSPSSDFISISADGFEDEWNRWIAFRLSQDGRVNEIQQAEVLRRLLERKDTEAAKKDIAFSISVGAKNMLDHRNDLSKKRSTTQKTELRI